MLIPVLVTHAIQVADCRAANVRHLAVCGPTPPHCLIRNYRDSTGVVVCSARGLRWVAFRSNGQQGAAAGAWTISSQPQ